MVTSMVPFLHRLFVLTFISLCCISINFGYCSSEEQKTFLDQLADETNTSDVRKAILHFKEVLDPNEFRIFFYYILLRYKRTFEDCVETWPPPQLLKDLENSQYDEQIRRLSSVKNDDVMTSLSSIVQSSTLNEALKSQVTASIREDWNEQYRKDAYLHPAFLGELFNCAFLGDNSLGFALFGAHSGVKPTTSKTQSKAEFVEWNKKNMKECETLRRVVAGSSVVHKMPSDYQRIYAKYASAEEVFKLYDFPENINFSMYIRTNRNYLLSSANKSNTESEPPSASGPAEGPDQSEPIRKPDQTDKQPEKEIDSILQTFADNLDVNSWIKLRKAVRETQRQEGFQKLPESLETTPIQSGANPHSIDKILFGAAVSQTDPAALGQQRRHGHSDSNPATRNIVGNPRTNTIPPERHRETLQANQRPNIPPEEGNLTMELLLWDLNAENISDDDGLKPGINGSRSVSSKEQNQGVGSAEEFESSTNGGPTNVVRQGPLLTSILEVQPPDGNLPMDLRMHSQHPESSSSRLERKHDSQKSTENSHSPNNGTPRTSTCCDKANETGVSKSFFHHESRDGETCGVSSATSQAFAPKSGRSDVLRQTDLSSDMKPPSEASVRSVADQLPHGQHPRLRAPSKSNFMIPPSSYSAEKVLQDPQRVLKEEKRILCEAHKKVEAIEAHLKSRQAAGSQSTAHHPSDPGSSFSSNHGISKGFSPHHEIPNFLNFTSVHLAYLAALHRHQNPGTVLSRQIATTSNSSQDGASQRIPWPIDQRIKTNNSAQNSPSATSQQEANSSVQPAGARMVAGSLHNLARTNQHALKARRKRTNMGSSDSETYYGVAKSPKTLQHPPYNSCAARSDQPLLCKMLLDCPSPYMSAGSSEIIGVVPRSMTLPSNQQGALYSQHVANTRQHPSLGVSQNNRNPLPRYSDSTVAPAGYNRLPVTISMPSGSGERCEESEGDSPSEKHSSISRPFNKRERERQERKGSTSQVSKKGAS